MAEKRFSSASYIDIPAENYYTTADDPNKLGFTQRGGLYKDGKGFTGYAPVISEGKFSGKQKLYINGIAAQGLKFKNFQFKLFFQLLVNLQPLG
jgi:hypothetical protein